MEEIWKDIEGFEGLYQVSNLGRVKHLEGYNHCSDFILMPFKNNKGYCYVSLSKNNKVKKFLVHRLVAMHFVEIPKHLLEYEVKKLEVDHINGDVTANICNNLRWCTRKENCNFPLYRKNSSKNGCWMYQRCLELHPRAKKIAQYDKEGNLLALWNTAKEAEIKTDIKRSGICQCCKGKRQSAGGYIWEYAKE